MIILSTSRLGSAAALGPLETPYLFPFLSFLKGRVSYVAQAALKLPIILAQPLECYFANILINLSSVSMRYILCIFLQMAFSGLFFPLLEAGVSEIVGQPVTC